MDENPYKAPAAPSSQAKRSVKRSLGTAILCLGVMAAVYGLFNFFVAQWLPPNNPTDGRLPSLYVTVGGLVTVHTLA